MTEETRFVVVGVDGSEESKAALRWSTVIAEATNSTIAAVIVWQYPMSADGWAPAPVDWNPGEDAHKTLEATVDEVFGAERPIGLRLAVRQGDAAKALLDESSEAQMLIVGSRGHGGFMGLLLGSVSAKCAEHARCPVLVVHGADHSTIDRTEHVAAGGS
jgi:nucleotide-binding universal stress UspA family protein